MSNQRQMTPERFKQIEELYHATRDRTAEESAALKNDSEHRPKSQA
jgi:hypothetical protein